MLPGSNSVFANFSANVSMLAAAQMDYAKKLVEKFA
jgi:hypothetical protein